MEAMREAWTDDRLDNLNGKVDAGFARMDARFNAMEARMDQRFDAMQAHFDKRLDTMQAHLDKRLDTMQVHLDTRLEGQDRRFEAIDERLDGLQRILVVTQMTFILGLLGLFATQV